MKAIRVGVIGIGNMGQKHARILLDLPGAQLCAVADPSEDARRGYRAPTGVRVYDDHNKMLEAERLDAVVIAVPSVLHEPVACDVARHGCHMLVEKPIAKTLAHGESIVRAARTHGVKLMVGHIERFNPAVVEAKRMVGDGSLGQIFQVHARRLSPFPPRIGDVGVILDLATHDIDAMHFVIGSPVVRAFAETAQKAHATCEDMISALIRFQTGEIGMLDVSWLSPKKLRELWIVGEGGTLLVDYLSQDVYWFKNGRVNVTWEPASHFSGAVEGDMVKTYIPKKEPLRAELESFVRCILEDTQPEVSGEEGLAALRVALDLIRSGRENCIVKSQRAAS
jgi:predicted dehydrogenase